jgi:hypothetical protein
MDAEALAKACRLRGEVAYEPRREVLKEARV